MPQARMTHQPRKASNNMKAPKTTSPAHSQTLYWHAKMPPPTNSAPLMPRTKRPPVPMLREKNFILVTG